MTGISMRSCVEPFCSIGTLHQRNMACHLHRSYTAILSPNPSQPRMVTQCPESKAVDESYIGSMVVGCSIVRCLLRELGDCGSKTHSNKIDNKLLSVLCTCMCFLLDLGYHCFTLDRRGKQKWLPLLMVFL